jgi:hypothetical protein
MGRVPYSKRYKQLNSAIGFWNEMLCRKQGNRVKSKHLQRLIKKAAIPTPLCTINQYTLEQIKAARWQNFKDYNDFVSKAHVARTTWLEELAEARAKEDLKKRPTSKKKKRATYEVDEDHDEKAPLKKGTAKPIATTSQHRAHTVISSKGQSSSRHQSIIRHHYGKSSQ